MAKESTPRINVTTNYRLFGRSDQNRPLALKRHKKLLESMRQYGFLKCFPIVCYRDKDKHLVVKDGQHRLSFAETLGLPVYWVEEQVDFDVARINSSSKGWCLADYVQKFEQQGLSAYKEGREFAEMHRVPLGVSFALLAGTTSFGNIDDDFYLGTFKVNDRQWADRVAAVYGPLTQLSPRLRTTTFMLACMALSRVEQFDPERMVQTATRCREKLVPYGTRDAYLEMLETVYNFGRKTLVPLRIEAMKAMRDRCAVKPSKNGSD